MATPEAATSPQATVWKWWICGLLLLATTLNYMDRTALNQTASQIKSAFGLNNEQYGQLEGIFSFAFAIGAPFFGFFVDRVGVRWIYPLVVFGWSAAGFLTGFVGSWEALVVCRFFLGFFEAGNWPCGIRTTRELLRPEERSLGNALFQSGTAIGAILTPLVILACLEWDDRWQIPFRVIGGLGLLWILLWFVSLHGRSLRTPNSDNPSAPEKTPTSFRALLLERRYLLLVVMIIAINHTWHSFRVWMPLFLQEAKETDRDRMMLFSAVYYLCADVGSWTIGWLTLRWQRGGMPLFAARMRAFRWCALLALTSIAAAFAPKGPSVFPLLLIVGFAALGLFPTYFALSQELSAQHQGKVTGTLGCINAMYLALLFPLQGKSIDASGFGLVIAIAGTPPLLAYLVVSRFWGSETAASELKS